MGYEVVDDLWVVVVQIAAQRLHGLARRAPPGFGDTDGLGGFGPSKPPMGIVEVGVIEA